MSSPSIPPQQVVEALQWRYATRKFDPAKPVSAADWEALEQTLVLAPSSVGLQPWRFLVVTDQAMKEKLLSAAWNQVQVVECSHFVVFTVALGLGAAHVDKHIARMVEIRGGTVEALAKFRTMAVGNLEQARAEGRLDTWQTHQIYIALGQFMAAAAMMGIDTCPMEGFEPAKFDEIVGLKGSGYASVVCCAVGYRLPDDKFASLKKVRFKPEDVIVRI